MVNWLNKPQTEMHQENPPKKTPRKIAVTARVSTPTGRPNSRPTISPALKDLGPSLYYKIYTNVV